MIAHRGRLTAEAPQFEGLFSSGQSDRAEVFARATRKFLASELMGYVRDMTIDGLMDNKPHLLWASHYLSALAKALMDDAELGMMR